ncbi:MAG: hypothetical protein IPK32_07185 [Verrucomicrobiaceae bacterium]|nr:hypothetical protein [Verrucomicrobiaceae bacterium]
MLKVRKGTCTASKEPNPSATKRNKPTAKQDRKVEQSFFSLPKTDFKKTPPIQRCPDAYHFLVAAAGDAYTWEEQAWVSTADWQELGVVLKQAHELWAPQIEKDARITDAWRKRPYLQSGFYKRRSLICSAIAHYNWERLPDDQIGALRRESREWAAISLRTSLPPSLEPQAAGRITSFGNGGFGFLRNRVGEDFQFRLSDVIDPEIRTRISESQGHYDIAVDFDSAAKDSLYAKYWRAQNIRAPGFKVFQVDSIHDQSSPGHGFMTAIESGFRNTDIEAYFSLLFLPLTLQEIPSAGDLFLASVDHKPHSYHRAQFTCREMREIWRADRESSKKDTSLSIPQAVVRSKEFLELARSATIEEDYQKAIQYYEDCMTLKVWPDCVYRFAALLKNLERDDEAAEVYRRGMAIWPDKYKIFEDAGVHAMSQRDHVKALPLLRRAVELAHAAPGRVGEKGALLALGRALSDIGTQEALQEALLVYHNYFEAYGEEAFLAGRVPSRDIHAWEKVKEQTREFSRQVSLSEEVMKAIAFFQNAGFKHQNSKVSEQGWTDLVFDTPADWEEVRLRQQVFVRCLSQEYRKGVDLDGVQEEVKNDYPAVDQAIAFLIAAQFSEGLKANLASRLHSSKNTVDGFKLFFVDMTYGEVAESSDARKTLHDRITNRIADRDAFAVASVVQTLQFFGREALLAEVSNLVLQDQAVGIFGLRRSGKTSFLAKFEEQQRAKDNLTVRVDCQVKGTADATYQAIGELLYDQVERKHPGTIQWYYCDKNTRAAGIDFIDGLLKDLESIIRLFRQLPREDRPRILVFLDEFDYLVENQEADAFSLIGGLRGLHQIHPESLGLIVAAPNVSLQEIV